MAAPLASRIRQLAHAGPAVAADNPLFVMPHQALADDTANRQEEIASRAQRAFQSLPAAFFKASHIAVRSGSTPNHRSNAAAP